MLNELGRRICMNWLEQTTKRLAAADEGSNPDESRGSGRDRLSTGTPEDVAALFTWANLQGARYWDFSESRRRYREQVRARAAAALAAREQASDTLDSISASPFSGSAAAHDDGWVSSIASRHGIKEIQADGPYFLRSQRFGVAEAFVESSRQTAKYHADLLWEPAPLRAAQEPPTEDPGEIWRSSLDDERLIFPASGNSSRVAGASAPGRPRESWIYSDLSPSFAPTRSGDSSDSWNISRDSSGSVAGANGGFGRDSQREMAAALVLVFSEARRVGKTSLIANLARALAGTGERIAVGDTEARSPLALYFGAREVRPGLARSFASPVRPADPAVFVANYELEAIQRDPVQQRLLMGEILRNGAQSNRILLDLPATADWLFRRLATLQPAVLVPLIPDDGVLLTLDAVERFFESITDSDGEPLRPLYLPCQFDPTSGLHADVREVLEHQLGPRLLPGIVRRSALVAEALSEGMTVVEYAPSSPVALDYLDVAAALRALAPPALATAEAGGAR